MLQNILQEYFSEIFFQNNFSRPPLNGLIMGNIYSCLKTKIKRYINILEYYYGTKSNVPEYCFGTFFRNKIKCSETFFWNIFLNKNQMFTNVFPVLIKCSRLLFRNKFPEHFFPYFSRTLFQKIMRNIV